MRDEGRAPPCPKCGSERTVPILYGYPSHEAREAEERREVVLGGCVITGDDPEWACLACGHRWGQLRLGDAQ